MRRDQVVDVIEEALHFSSVGATLDGLRRMRLGAEVLRRHMIVSNASGAVLERSASSA